MNPEEFCEMTGLKIKKKYLGHFPHFVGEKDQRAVFEIIFKRASFEFSMKYGASIADSYSILLSIDNKPLKEIEYCDFIFIAPEIEKSKLMKEMKKYGRGSFSCRAKNHFYEVIVRRKIPEVSDYDILSIITKNDPGTFREFCSDYGYIGNTEAMSIYEKVQEEWKNVSSIFSESELEMLRSIQ